MPVIKVKISSTIEVNVDEWAQEYGVPNNSRSVRKDVEEYFSLEDKIPDHLQSFVFVVPRATSS